MSDLLTADPDAASLFSEADHWDRLAAESAEAARRSGREALMARRRSEELKHKLDPRGRRRVHISAGLVVLAAVAGCLTILDQVQLSGVAGHLGTLPVALCATATWLMAAWTLALAGREDRCRAGTLIAAGGITLSALMAVVHVLLHSARALHWRQAALSATVALLINALTVGAAALISRMEPWAVAAARSRSHRAARRYGRKALQAGRDAAEAANASRHWLRRVQLQALTAPSSCRQDGDRAVSAALKIAAALHSTGAQPGMPTHHAPPGPGSGPPRHAPPGPGSGPPRHAPPRAPKAAAASPGSGPAF